MNFLRKSKSFDVNVYTYDSYYDHFVYEQFWQKNSIKTTLTTMALLYTVPIRELQIKDYIKNIGTAFLFYN